MADDTLNDVLIDRLRSFLSKPNENLDGIRSAAARLHSRCASQDKATRERTLERVWRRHDGAIPLVLSLLESVRDQVTCCSLAGILHECVSPRAGTSGKKKAQNHAVKYRSPALSQLTSLNATQLIIKLLMQLSGKESQISDMLLYELVWIIAQLSQKDSKFSVKVRLMGSARTFHNILRLHYNNPKLLYPLLIVFKSLSRNVTTSTVLVKDGIVSTMEKVIVSIGYSPSPKLRLSLNVMHSLTRSKLCCTKMAKEDFVPLLLRIFERWERYNGKMRLRILTYTIITLKHLSNTKIGRKAIKSSNGLNLLYKFCVLCPNDRTYDSLLPRVASIIGTCMDKKVLPIDTTGPVLFSLPVLKTENSDTSDNTTGSGMRTSSSRETTPSADGSVAESFDNNDDDDDDASDKTQESDAGHGPYAIPPPILRDMDDLCQYAAFFQENVVTSNQEARTFEEKCIPRAKSYQEFGSHGCDSLGEHRDYWLINDRDGLRSDSYLGSCHLQHQEPSNDENSFWQKEVERRLNNYMRTVRSHSSCSCYDVYKREMTWKASSDPAMNSNLQNSLHMMGLTILSDIPKHSSVHYAYCAIASKVNTVYPVVKVAYPDMVGGDGSGQLYPLHIKDRKVCRAKLMTSVERAVHPHLLLDRVVYDLDGLIQQDAIAKGNDSGEKHLYNIDERRVGHRDLLKHHLLFESRFESGNLRKVVQIGLHEYELILLPDVNSVKHHQWFYFEVSNMEANVTYTFNIVNCEKQNSQFNYGMKPIMYSVIEAKEGRPGWVRAGSDICYYRNNYQNLHGRSRSWYLTTSFSMTFPHDNDVCYIAYHFPYPYSLLMTQIWKWSLSVDPSLIYFRTDCLCYSLNNNETPLLTITSPDMESNRIKDREVVFLTARVHPGESNASWVMHGTIQYLLSNAPAAIMVRNKFVFKIVPMLNMEGVINGCHRCGLSDEDLNRRWSRPNQYLHPVIYHSKGLIEYCARIMNKTPFMFCDYHGHSRRKNVFLYGCCNAGSWNQVDRSNSDDPVDYLMLPYLMQHFSKAFNLQACNFRVERMREATARVTIWREFGVKRSYTMESSFCGCDQGFYQGYHLDTIHLKEIGANFCEAMACLKDEGGWKADITPEEAARLAGLTSKEQLDESPPMSEISDNSDFSSDEDFH
ncbi:hypothetical protein R5R35_006136 [Gryllus longicercus]|uniref:tubulin-glutamate carboxypeptidase n=1 Tax=Gryllus longicercus TaxID=2509291 RepID=A0AAN9VAT3_9ORTH